MSDDNLNSLALNHLKQLKQHPSTNPPIHPYRKNRNSSFLGLSLKLYAPVKNVAKFPAIAQPGLVAAERIFELLDTEPTVVERPNIALDIDTPEDLDAFLETPSDTRTYRYLAGISAAAADTA